ncbi:ribonuclease E/G [Alkalihalobacillus macyae]|uniref:ribonuclease E/G n=1 Tax=Guptibacillus hwajinpoensis TaxID=208199 RepID=UPI00273AE82B|nr:ribonuclease E/G [Alkalihalobacillus macyae]MDP4550448.1 ribonuclease E/G [Alkalihalobacillus macyae]
MQLIVLEKKEWRAAAIEIDNIITDIWVDRVDRNKLEPGDVILGKVSDVLDEKSAAFISLGKGKPGLLNGSELALAQYQKTAGGVQPAVSDCLEEGQAILVQVKHQGVDRKGPIITELVTFTGETLVYMPYAGYSAVSKQLSLRREELLAFAEKNCIEQEGLIFRTSAGYVEEEKLYSELLDHREEWQRLLEKASTKRAPLMIKKAKGLSEQISKLFPLQRVTSIVSNSTSAMEGFLPFLNRNVDVTVGPDEVSKVEETIASMEKTIKIGKANVHIEETNALTAIDVDTAGAKYGTKNQTHYEVNVLAIEEITRQLRLRNIGGLIVVDFLRVDKQDQRKLLTLLRNKEKEDPRLKVGGFTNLGLFEMQRKKAGLPLSSLISKL